MEYRLADRYLAESGKVYLTGIQALVRVPIEQVRRDHAAGRNTAAFVSGYPGSPLGGFDQELGRALKVVEGLPIVHLPAVNEELGASAVMGSQLVSTRRDATYDGVVGVWYGKAPGLDRATDALRHGVFAGSSATGGAIALVGDDPAAKSSTMPSSSDAALVDLHMPILYPATVAECLELGLHGIAMSRATGLWSAMKVVTPIADGTGTVDLPALADEPVIPTTTIDGELWKPHPSAQFLGPRMVAVEREFHEIRSELARRYGVENRLNQATTNPTDAWIGIVATGYTYTQVLEALRRLGLRDLAAIGDAGIRLLNLRMPVPFDSDQIVRFAAGLDEIFVIEEKNPTLERLVRDCLYDSAIRPRVTGKQGPHGSKLLPSYGLLDADAIVPALRARLVGVLGDALAPEPPRQRELIPLAVQRAPFFCSGCPHNRGTKVPEGAVVGMGTGCHGMTLLMDDDRVGESIGITAMGNEGAQWLGMAPFVETAHVFQNFGDGTYFHSGQLAIQAAIGAGANVTFKILYNHTVAMTGGQETSHRVGPADLASVLLTHGVSEVAITTDDTAAYKGRTLPNGVEVHDRADIVTLQQRLSSVAGVTVLIHDQECAAELRRGRKRGLLDTPKTRVVINHRICEGCGDCGDVSNCLSVQPVETPLGRKTRIDQASCNIDLSCLEGDCPAFMTVQIEEQQTQDGRVSDPTGIELGEAVGPDRAATTIRMAGIGGTGVVTVAQILGTAAMLSGMEVDGVDQTGLSQKAGPVISDVTIVAAGAPRQSNLIGDQQADVILGFDIVVAASDATIGVASADHTSVFVSSSQTPTGAQVVNPELHPQDATQLLARLNSRSDRALLAPASELAAALTGTPATANIFLLGVASQAGEIPVPTAAIHEAIELNGIAIDQNVSAFEWGRRWFVDPNAVEAVRASQGEVTLGFDPPELLGSLSDRVHGLDTDDDVASLVAGLAADLVEYQNEAYAVRFLDLVERAAALDDRALTEAVARNYYKLMAYKDEFEVARLMLAPDGIAALGDVPSADRSTITWHLHPPLLRALGLKRKLRFGPRSAPLFRLLARGKRLRGTRLDPFGYATLRRAERELIDQYERVITQMCEEQANTRDHDIEKTIAIALLPASIRGFEHLKTARIAEYRAKLDSLVTTP